MDKKPKYSINSDGEFVIENYNHAGPFSNFLPGIAGLFGIPMWAFYVNRAQCMCSFGTRSKDSPIMEFLPANRAYQLTSSQGFRTFIKVNKGKKPLFYEPFQAHPENGIYDAEQKMCISSHELRLKERISKIGLEIEVVYFTIPNESFAALARIVTFKNISGKPLSMDVLDGTPLVIPYGVSNFFLQKMRRTVEAWMRVENIKKNAPFYRLNVDPRDVSEVSFIEEGNFYLASLCKGDKERKHLPVFVDPELIFGEASDFSYPVNFVNQKDFNVPSLQMAQNKLPSAMSMASVRLKKGEKAVLYSLMGHISSMDKLNSLVPRLGKPGFFTKKREENRDIVKDLQKNVFTASNEPRFDLYCGQTFLDNVIRGGYAVNCGADSHTFYAYSRKHGDLERDYNRFYIEPTYFSQGNGNYRDMNQNRRSDVFFNPEVKDSNILHFYNLQQPDGFNPLVLKGMRFRLKRNIEDKNAEKILDLLRKSFTPGELFMEMEARGIKLKRPWHKFLNDILKNCEVIFDAEHAEGFWVDHWTYNLDLVESYLAIYPEKLKEILIEKEEFTFFDNSHYVRPRSERCILNGNSMVRQYYSVGRDGGKEHIIKKRQDNVHLVRTMKGKGQVYKTNLLVKMLCIVANKISSLDPSGIGIEMEADKPGWCDSMNGLPGLFGSSMPEVFELKRQVVFILESLKKLGIEAGYKTKLPEELHDLLKKLGSLIKLKNSDFNFWDKASSLKEKYREKTRPGFSGVENLISLSDLSEMLERFLSKIDSAIKKAYIPSKNIYTTYFINEVSRYKRLNKIDPIKGLPLVKPTAFKSIRLPLFLEGVVRAMKVEKDIDKTKRLYSAVKKTGLYDKKLKMYKINEPLEGVSKEIGRSSVFTPGWLENESIWLHMEYKYILEILKAGLYKEFFEELKNVLIPFQNPEIYGRSIFENSSFLVSSAFQDKKFHGRGFIARLSGSTAEMMNIWLLMNAGKSPFFIDKNDMLNLKFKPVLPGWLFTEKAQLGFPKASFAFRFLGKTLVVYHNPRRKNTAGRGSARTRFMVLRYEGRKKVEIKSDTIGMPYSQDIRDRKVKRIDIYLG
ncbi:MAG: hypothetical protein KJ902_05405 [Candidatus Omnitrophica bacterium]|nr:hypothetical protein [Candidatus Omnitrophota bacterium]MBU4458164.1 hypothetical protein [Candidatus Omnitrophota bacterium]